MENAINIAKMLFMRDLPHDGVYIDFTLKDGYDTLYMAKYASEGDVFSFETDASRMENVYRLLEKNFQDNVHIVREDPLELKKYVRGGVNGFIADTTRVVLDEEKLIEIVSLAVDSLKKNGRGLVVIDGERFEAYERLRQTFASYSRDVASVIEMTESNTSAPTAYIVEKVK